VPIYASLLDGNEQKLGPYAGTSAVDAGQSDVIDEVIVEPGTYYVAMDSAGDAPSYAIRFSVVPASSTGSGGTGTSAAALKSLTVSSPQRALTVSSRATFGAKVKRLTSKLTLYFKAGGYPAGTTVGKSVLLALQSGLRTVKIQLSLAGRTALKRAGALRLRLAMTATPYTGASVTKSRLLTLKAPQLGVGSARGAAGRRHPCAAVRAGGVRRRRDVWRGPADQPAAARIARMSVSGPTATRCRRKRSTAGKVWGSPP